MSNEEYENTMRQNVEDWLWLYNMGIITLNQLYGAFGTKYKNEIQEKYPDLEIPAYKCTSKPVGLRLPDLNDLNRVSQAPGQDIEFTINENDTDSEVVEENDEDI